MLEINDCLIYGSYGVCRLSDVTKEEFNGKQVDYYVLEPVYNKNSKVLVPTDNENLISRMHFLATKEVLSALIESIPSIEKIWEQNEPKRKEMYNEMLIRRDRAELLGIIKTLEEHREEQALKKRRLHVCDEKVLTQAQKTIYEEIAFVFGMEPDRVPDYIAEKISTE